LEKYFPLNHSKKDLKDMMDNILPYNEIMTYKGRKI
jgi:hypothetical protein